MTQPIPTLPNGEPIPCRGCQYFTGPGCGCDNAGHDRPQNPGPRPGLDQISSDDLDTLYARAENAEAELEQLRARVATAEHVARSNLRHVQAIVPDLEAAIQRAEQLEDLLRVANDTSNRSEAERARAVQHAEQADAVTAETKRLLERRTTTLRERAERAEAAAQQWREATGKAIGQLRQAEAAIERVRAATHIADAHDVTDWQRGYRACADRIRAALDEHQEQPATPPVHIGNRANAEDCPACSGTNPPYPFICPGPTKEN